MMVTSVFFGGCYQAAEADTSKTDTNCGCCRPPVSPRTLLLQIEFKLVKVTGWGWWLVLCGLSGLNKHLAIRTHIKIVSSLRTDKHNLG